MPSSLSSRLAAWWFSLLLWGFVAPVGAGDRSASAQRPQIPLAGDWQRQLLPDAGSPPADQWEAKPMQLPGLALFPKSGKKALLTQRTIAIPAGWAGRRTVLCISHPLIGVAVTLNGTSAGEIPGYGGELDLTAQTQPGRDNILQLRFFHRGEGLASLDAYVRDCLPALKAGVDDKGGLLGTPEGFYLESRPAQLAVTDVWYRTFTRSKQRLEPQISLVNYGEATSASCTIEITDPATGKPVLSQTFAPEPLPAGASERTYIVAAEKLKQWWPNAAKLYSGQVIVKDPAGQELDRSRPVLFGVRELWTQGKQFYLNNAPIHFTLDAYYFEEGSLEKNLRRALASGITLTYGHHGAAGTAISHDQEDWATLCDQLGMGLMSWGVSVGNTDFGNPDVLNAYRRWTAAHLRRIRNHPSILFLCLSTNYAGGSDSPEAVGNSQKMRWNQRDAGLSYLIHRELDPTRLYFHHAGGGVADFDTSNTYSNHLPHQEIADWLSVYEEKADRPYMVVEFNGVPLDVDYVKHYSNLPLVSYATEYAARLAGERAYAQETPEYRQDATYRIPRLKDKWDVDGGPFWYSPLLVEQNAAGMREVTLACRFRKVATDLWVWQPSPKKFPEANDPRRVSLQKLASASLALQAPLHLWIGGPADDWTEKGHHYYSGETIRKSLLVIDDRRMAQIPQVAAVWEAKFLDNGEIAAKGDSRESGEIPAPWYARLKIPLNFPAPTVSAPRDLELTARLLDGKSEKELGTATFRLTVYPPLQPLALAAAPAFALIDPAGVTGPFLKKYGLTTVADSPQARKTAAGLILGRGALNGMAALPFTAAEIANGLRVYVFEQHNDTLGRFGLRYEAHSPRMAFPRQTAHPLMQGLTAESLHDWRGASTLVGWGPERDGTANSRRAHHWSNRGTVASVMIETPHFGPFRALADMEFDLAYTPLLQWRHGKGELVFCQFDVTARTASDPAVDRLAQNFVRYAATPLTAPEQNKILVCAEESLRVALGKLGFATAAKPDGLAPERILLALDGAQPLPAEAASFLRNGGTALAVGAQSAFLQQPELAGLQVTTVPRTSVGNDAPEDSLLAGVGPQHLRWRHPLTLPLLAGAAPGAVVHLDGLLGVVPFGKGRLVLLQLTDAALRDTVAVRTGDQPKEGQKPLTDSWYLKDRARSLWQANRLRALLLANLGAMSSEELLQGFFSPKRSLPFLPIDKWTYLGPLPAPQEKEGDPLNADLGQLLANRNPDLPTAYQGKNYRWIMPTDVNNGLGLGGFMNLGTVFSAVERQGALAVTHLWSTEERTATLQVGADWWLRIQINGKEVFRTGTVDGFSGSKFAKGFGFSVKAPLKKGWNEVACLVGSGSNGNGFWFQVSNPGDVVAEPSLAQPKEAPWLFLRFARGSGTRKNDGQPVEKEDDSATPSFSVYTEPLSVHDDPYLFMRW